MNFLDPALQFCTHLIYGYAGIKEENFNIASLDESLDINKQNYKHIVELKRRFPGLRVLLSVGGNRDVSGEGSEKNLKYRTLVRFRSSQTRFWVFCPKIMYFLCVLSKCFPLVGIGGNAAGFH